MAWSKSTRISIMLAIDVAFFLVELITGFAVHSLALLADAFHMLNDIISLLVGLWAVNLAQKATTDKYSYGWLRAEILGAFFNAVFLIALCVSIVLEAVTRFFDPPEISNPQLILTVGCFGLASNLVGFVVLGGHGHEHGHEEHDDDDDGEHEHEHVHAGDGLVAAEEGRAAAHERQASADADALPEAAVAKTQHANSPSMGSRRMALDGTAGSLERIASKRSRTSRGRSQRRGSSGRHGFASIEDISIYPASFRQDIIAATKPQPRSSNDESSESDDNSNESAIADDLPPSENTPLLQPGQMAAVGNGSTKSYRKERSRRDSSLHNAHNHNKPKKAGQSSHGHNHADMGMNAMILHVLGDALGNVGVIVTALIIWLTDWPGKYYADPAVSLFITIIILRSALPLTFATSKILLQATPEGIEVQDIRQDIETLPGVMSCHHMHIWQLSDTKIVASMHIHVAFPISEAGGEKYMVLAKRVRRCLHAYGIHSATIQPEFCLDSSHGHAEDARRQFDGSADTVAVATARKCGSADSCLLECIDNCVGKGCCSIRSVPSPPASSYSSHSHDHF